MAGSDFTVTVKTGDRLFAGTDSNVKIILHGLSGTKSEDLNLDNFFLNDFEQGKEDHFSLRNVNFLENIEYLEIWKDDFGVAPAWYAEKIDVKNETSGNVFTFPIHRWIKTGRRYHIRHLNTSLPQNEVFKDQRKEELEEKRSLYEYTYNGDGMPAQVKNVPEDEKFSFSYRWDIAKRKYKMIIDKNLQLLFSGRHWEGLPHLKRVYSKSFGEPMGSNRWNDDMYFGWQRINSINHSLIKLCTEIPENLDVTEEMLRPFLEGSSIQQAIDAKRLFMVDLKILDGLPRTTEDRICPAPIALFFSDGKSKLLPIAIQLFQQKAADNPVFLPTDPPYTWLMAKMWYNLADASYHQSLTHLGFTHLIMEGIVICTHRNLSQSHPLFKLLAPHFLYLIAINKRALQTLVAPGGWVDKTMNIGTKGMFNLTARGMSFWRMDVHGTLPEDLKQRGVYCTSGKVLPGYYFRDDAILLYNAIKNYVTKYVKLYYDTTDIITGDMELQNFGKELVRSREDNGLGILGVPNNGKFETADHLVLVFTSIIYTCSVAHAATNFPQYDEYAFPLNYPATLNGVPPKDKRPLTEEDILHSLPDKETTLDIMTVTKILSEKGTKSLGDFEVQYVFDPNAQKIIEEFREELKSISAEVKRRNEHRNPKYTWLDPEVVPNSISI